MNRTLKEVLFAVSLGLLVPAVLLQLLSNNIPARNGPVVAFSEPSVQQTTSAETEGASESVEVLLQSGKVLQMEMDAYLTCVLLAEMPADFEMEALKAQAIVARTYTYKRISTPHKHEQAALCADPGCCQAYCDEEAFLAKGGTGAQIGRIRAAVADTKQQVLTYSGELIEATYFSCSGGRTEAAVAVWGEDIPYLQAVDSPGEELADRYIDTVTFDCNVFASALDLTLTGPPETWFGEVTYTDGGGVKSIQIGQTEFDGVTVRQKLGLRSTQFVITAVGQTITVTTKGFGHRVGMSQYGAEAMAVKGADHRQILEHYYQGTKIETWQCN